MKPKNALCAAAAACFLLAATAGRAPAKDDYPYEQSYTIQIENEASGTETVTEKKDGSGKVVSTSEHDILVTDGMALNRMRFSTRAVFPKNSTVPEIYVTQYKSGAMGDSYDVAVRNNQITRTLTRNGQTTTATAALTPDMVILDFNVYHQYECLARRYDRKKEGTQTFADFIPVIGNDIPLRVTFLNDETRQFGQKSVELRNFRVEFVGIQTVTLSVDKNNRLVQLDSPSQRLRVIRKDLLP